MTVEWGFEEHSQSMDLEELTFSIAKRFTTEFDEIQRVSFMAQMHLEAPILYYRLKAYAKDNGLMTWHEWRD